MKAIGEIIKEKNLQLDTLNPVLRGGFTQLPNFILRTPLLSMGSKVTYALFLSYAWNNDFCFSGQDRLAEDMGMSRVRVTQFVSELKRAGLVSIRRRGQGDTNLYTIHFQVKQANSPAPVQRSEETKSIEEIAKERNLQLDTINPVLHGGFTQMPNFILRDPALSVGAKVAYALFLSYAWHNDCCFAGQDRLAEDMGMTRVRVTQFISELQLASLVSIRRRGQCHTNLYTIHFQVKWPNRPASVQHPEVSRLTSRCKPLYIQR